MGSVKIEKKVLNFSHFEKHLMNLMFLLKTPDWCLPIRTS